MSITWITPLEATTSAEVTVASFTLTPSAFTVKVRSSVFSAATTNPSVKSVESTFPETT